MSERGAGRCARGKARAQRALARESERGKARHAAACSTAGRGTREEERECASVWAAATAPHSNNTRTATRGQQRARLVLAACGPSRTRGEATQPESIEEVMIKNRKTIKELQQLYMEGEENEVNTNFLYYRNK